jgi:hypothetical protein
MLRRINSKTKRKTGCIWLYRVHLGTTGSQTNILDGDRQSKTLLVGKMCIQTIAEDVFLVLKLIWKQVTISKWRLTKYVFIFLQRYIITTTTMCETVDYIASSLFQPVFRLVLELILRNILWFYVI